MKSFIKSSLFLLAVVLLSSISCRKDKLDSNGLPPATQEGKNTLGFLLNGQPWTPKGFNGTANLSLYYDPSYRGGVFNISAYRLLNDSNKNRQRITIAADSIQVPEKIVFGEKNFTVIFKDSRFPNCSIYSRDSIVFLNGECNITKLDRTNRIFSGTFEFTFVNFGCDTIKITEGRFDMKLQ